MRAPVLLALVGLSSQLLTSDACARRHYTLTVTEVVPNARPRATGTYRGPAELPNPEERGRTMNEGGPPTGSPSSEPVAATTGTEQQTPRSMRGFSDSPAKQDGSPGEQIAERRAAAEEH